MTNFVVVTKRAELSYDVCEKCGGLWFDRGELDKMAFQITGSIEFCSNEETPIAQRPCRICPRCDGFELSRVRFLGETDIVLDHCRNCGGFWLDGGELNLIDQELVKIMPVSGHGFSDFVNNVHVPYWFKRIKRPSSETDFKVEVKPISGAKHLRSTDEDCPACGARLDLYSLLSIEFEGCPKCHGLWLDPDELRKLKNKVGIGELHWLNSEVDNIEHVAAVQTKRVCPRKDGGQLLSVVFGKSSIVLDWCPKCRGMWLDRGEYDKIIDYLRNEAGNATLQDVEKEIADNVRRLFQSGPESPFAELADIAAAVTALINFTIFEHPKMSKFVMMQLPLDTVLAWLSQGCRKSDWSRRRSAA
jgi:Zn-finger nucleic acid-binding protein